MVSSFICNSLCNSVCCCPCSLEIEASSYTIDIKDFSSKEQIGYVATLKRCGVNAAK